MKLTHTVPKAKFIRRPAQQKGFTLLELVIVIAILGTLFALVVPNIMGEPDKAKVAAVKIDIRQISSSLQRYYLHNNRYPTTEQGLQALVTRPDSEPVPKNWSPNGYLDKLPKDPWGNTYLYISPGEKNGAFDLYSLGRDGQPGGSDVDSDIGNWEPEEQ